MKRSKMISYIANEITFLDSNVSLHSAELIADNVLKLMIENGVRLPQKACRIIDCGNGFGKHSETEFGWDEE